jgi:cell division ATPase FtsA
MKNILQYSEKELEEIIENNNTKHAMMVIEQAIKSLREDVNSILAIVEGKIEHEKIANYIKEFLI